MWIDVDALQFIQAVFDFITFIRMHLVSASAGVFGHTCVHAYVGQAVARSARFILVHLNQDVLDLSSLSDTRA